MGGDHCPLPTCASVEGAVTGQLSDVELDRVSRVQRLLVDVDKLLVGGHGKQ